MKIAKQLILMTPLALLVAGCNVPVHPDTTIAEWEREGQLPRLSPTGRGGQRVYSQSADYPDQPSIVVISGQQQARSNDLALADAIRRRVEYDAGLAPSLTRVTIAVGNDVVTLQGTVKSDLDSRVIVDNVRDVPGVTLVKNDLQIIPGSY